MHKTFSVWSHAGMICTVLNTEGKVVEKGNRREQTGLRNIRTGRLAWQQIVEAGSEVWNQDGQTLSTAQSKGARSVVLYIARHHSDCTLRELGQLAGNMEYPAVTMAIRRLEQRLKFDKDLSKRARQA
jgi:hypothetical protein